MALQCRGNAGTMQRHTGTVQRHTGTMQRHTGTMQRHTGTMQRHAGTMPDQSGPGAGSMYLGLAKVVEIQATLQGIAKQVDMDRA
jgi:hypothetical protein